MLWHESRVLWRNLLAVEHAVALLLLMQHCVVIVMMVFLLFVVLVPIFLVKAVRRWSYNCREAGIEHVLWHWSKWSQVADFLHVFSHIIDHLRQSFDTFRSVEAGDLVRVLLHSGLGHLADKWPCSQKTGLVSVDISELLLVHDGEASLDGVPRNIFGFFFLDLWHLAWELRHFIRLLLLGDSWTGNQCLALSTLLLLPLLHVALDLLASLILFSFLLHAKMHHQWIVDVNLLGGG